MSNEASANPLTWTQELIKRQFSGLLHSQNFLRVDIEELKGQVTTLQKEIATMRREHSEELETLKAQLAVRFSQVEGNETTRQEAGASP